jgi:tetratricopeptide (TPR) repeat protein
MRRPARLGIGLVAWIGLVLALGVGAAGCKRVEPRVPYPHESILTIVAELKLFLEQDPYTQPPGTDLEGRNIFRVTLERLAQLEPLLDAEYEDVLAFARGECLERLGAWPEAAQAFAQAGATSSTLAAAALRRGEQALRMAALIDPAKFSPDLRGRMNDLQVAQQKLREWAGESPPWPIGSFIEVERERAQEQQARLQFTIERAIAPTQALAADNTRSSRAMQHQITLGTAFETMAREWTGIYRPEQTGIPEDAPWAGWVEAAREAYRKAALADGNPAKPEAQARLRALDAYALRMQNLGR